MNSEDEKNSNSPADPKAACDPAAQEGEGESTPSELPEAPASVPAPEASCEETLLLQGLQRCIRNHQNHEKAIASFEQLLSARTEDIQKAASKIQDLLNHVLGQEHRKRMEARSRIANSMKDLESKIRNCLEGTVLRDLCAGAIETADRFEALLQKQGERPEMREWHASLELIFEEFLNSLGRHGLERIPADGRFDPEVHAAAGSAELGTPIVGVSRSGYRFRGAVLRKS